MSYIPKKSEKYLSSEFIFYEQFNDFNFFFEDQGKEAFYYNILHKIFPTFKISKIYTLSGKTNVINHSKKHNNSKKNIYILDKDFDDILKLKNKTPNLFYLKKYSIENYLFEKEALLNCLLNHKPTLNRKLTLKIIPSIVKHCHQELIEITALYIIVRKNTIPIDTTSKKIHTFINQSDKSKINGILLNRYKDDIKKHLGQSIMLEKEILKHVSNKKINNHIPGKYLLDLSRNCFIKSFNLKSFHKAPQFAQMLSSYCEFESLKYLKTDIIKYTQR